MTTQDKFTMELQIKDRLYLPMLLPKEGNFKEFNLKKSILSKIELSAQEREEINLRENSETNRIEWDVDKDKPVTILFTHEEAEYLKQACEKLSEQTLHDDLWLSVERVYNSLKSEEE